MIYHSVLRQQSPFNQYVRWQVVDTELPHPPPVTRTE